MEVTINSVSDVQREAEFLMTHEELQPHFERAYKKYAPKVELKGFRKGKVPMEMIKKLYGEAIEQDALDDIANESFRSAMIERNVEPLGRPSLTDMDFKRGGHFKFTIKYEVKPTIELKKYKGIAVEKPVHHVTDEEVESEIERLRRINASMLGVTIVRDEGDHVITADVQELAEDGMPLVGKKTKDARFSLSDETLVKEIKEVLAKAEVGGEYRVRFEQQHGDHAHSHFIAISVKKIEKVELPDFDDAFVQKVTQENIATKEEFLANVRTDIQSYWAEQSERRVADTIIDEIVKAHEVVVPGSLIELYLDSFIEDMKGRSRDSKLPAGFDEAKFRNENRQYATYQAKWGLLREAIIEQEKIAATDDEIEQYAADEAVRLGIKKEQVVNYFKSSNVGAERVIGQKLMKLLRDNAKITEQVIEETR
ncbi:MAG: trigger factor [Bacteroidetes bacterium]|nr:trigger factor [Bacteroidota bacterium]MCW5896593.1 trigger factor [Bacteroidota bacterium]